jgi:hypothetical protein
MKKLGYFAVCAMLTMGICVAQDLANIILGTIQKVDSTTVALSQIWNASRAVL